MAGIFSFLAKQNYWKIIYQMDGNTTARFSRDTEIDLAGHTGDSNNYIWEETMGDAICRNVFAQDMEYLRKRKGE